MMRLMSTMVAIAGCGLAASCAARGIDVRAVLESDASSNLSMRVYVEGDDGNGVTGALVLVETPTSESSLLSWDSSLGCYHDTIPDAESGNYGLTVRAFLDSKRFEITVPHQVMSTRPLLKAISTADGSDALGGASLDRSCDIAVAWSAVAGASAYRLEARRAGIVVYASSSLETDCVIPAGSLRDAGSTAFSVLAQFRSGDPLFEAARYCSSSTAVGPTVYAVLR